MSGLSALVKAIHNDIGTGNEAVLATVVKVEGSAYRRPGARMVISQFGTQGAISGGCLESEVAKTAWWLTESGPVIRAYSTAEEDEDGDVALSFGLGCNGTVHVLFERVSLADNHLLVDTLSQVVDEDVPAVVATVINPGADTGLSIGQRLLKVKGEPAVGDFNQPELMPKLMQDLEVTMQGQRSSLHYYQLGDQQVEVFVEYVRPVPKLVICGAGYDAQPLAKTAKMLGWHVSVLDGRSHFANRQRFMEVDNILVTDVEQPFEYQSLFEGAAVVVMSHSLVQDAYWLQAALHSDPVYIGQLGPRDRTEKLLQQIEEQYGLLPALTKLHYPVGLDLGGDTPESVAIAILGEITANSYGRNGKSLKFRQDKIHDPDPVIRSQLTKQSLKSKLG
ncbi:XdhC family protein [Vibrio olivae]|uniref:XdhC family protein n=1 Tax=Vibrio olivae TaxID=1243002 RepID=A0ABV5HTZ9_9VIBR